MVGLLLLQVVYYEIDFAAENGVTRRSFNHRSSQFQMLFARPRILPITLSTSAISGDRPRRRFFPVLPNSAPGLSQRKVGLPRLSYRISD